MDWINSVDWPSVAWLFLMILVGEAVRRWLREDAARMQQEQTAREMRNVDEYNRQTYPETPIVPMPEARHPLDFVPYPVIPENTKFREKGLSCPPKIK